jgi:hypothetical protein
MVLGFSNPEPVNEAAADGQPLPASSEQLVLAKAMPDMLPDSLPGALTGLPARTADLNPPPRRPTSFARDDALDPVLDRVSSRRWIKPSHFSPDRARADLQRVVPGHFHGVGFPEIRTTRIGKQRRGYSIERPSYWSRMISWRPTGHDALPLEPIAHVRCMGLSPQAVARRADRYERLILDIAVEFDVSASLIKAIITEESCFNRKARSPVGAQGLMQLMPETAQWLKVRDPLDPEQNLRAGVRYFAYLQERFDSLELALAAYNAGPGNVRRYEGVPPFAETRAYVRKVQAHYRRYVAATRLAAS